MGTMDLTVGYLPSAPSIEALRARSGTADQVEITGLTNGTTYRFTVTATDAFGTGPASLLSVSVTPKMASNIMATGGITGDGRGDLIGLRSTAAERLLTDRFLYLYRGNGLGGWAGGGLKIGSGWSIFR